MTIAPLIRPKRGERTNLTAGGVRRPPTSKGMARRSLLVNGTKWALPAVALLLLASIALWPELARLRDQGRAAFRRVASFEADSGTMHDARYRGVDERGRPYTITADSATQAGPQRINLAQPKGDIVQENEGWVMVQAKDGVFIQHAGQLDLSHDVVVYRSDGTVMRTETAAVDIKGVAAATEDRTHAEGPFGTLDAQGFTLVDRGAVVQFYGPAHLVVNQQR